jgi:hypothetical protein
MLGELHISFCREDQKIPDVGLTTGQPEETSFTAVCHSHLPLQNYMTSSSKPSGMLMCCYKLLLSIYYDMIDERWNIIVKNVIHCQAVAR